MELWEKELKPGLSSIQYPFMNFVSKLLLTALMKFQTLISSRDSPHVINIQTLILVMFIDVNMPMPELTNGEVGNVHSTNKTRKILLFIMYVVFFKITAFLWIILILHPGHTSLFLETKTINFMWPWGLGAEGREKQIPESNYVFNSDNLSFKTQ